MTLCFYNCTLYYAFVLIVLWGDICKRDWRIVFILYTLLFKLGRVELNVLWHNRCAGPTTRRAPTSLCATCRFHRGHLRRAAGTGNVAKVRETALGGVFVSLYCARARAIVPARALLRAAERSEEDPVTGHAPAEVVVCAVGRVFTSPLVEMTAQSTALPALATRDPDLRQRALVVSRDQRLIENVNQENVLK